MELKGRYIGVVWEAADSGYYHDTLYTCIKFSKNQ